MTKKTLPISGVIFDAALILRKKRLLRMLGIPVLSLLGFALTPSISYAAHSPMLAHITQPQAQKTTFQKGESVNTTLNVQNVSPASFTTPLCVREVVGGQTMHVGCVPSVEFRGFDGGSRFSFSVPQVAQTPGQHTLIYSYRDLQGNWHEVLDSGHHLMRSTYTVQ